MRKLSSVIRDEKVKLVFQAMGSSLHASIASTNLDEEEEVALVYPVNMFGSPNQWNRFHNDVKIYMEACLAHAKQLAGSNSHYK